MFIMSSIVSSRPLCLVLTTQLHSIAICISLDFVSQDVCHCTASAPGVQAKPDPECLACLVEVTQIALRLLSLWSGCSPEYADVVLVVM
jgi:hypothetical protein